jgi:hypothetical protein
MAATTKRALLIGINYVNDDTSPLYGCVNDVKNMQVYVLRFES